ncbi:MAG: aminoacyl-tRNA deacylase [Candidatus Acidiferrum sp.]
MRRKEHASETPATTFLREHSVKFTEHLYDYVDRGGTAESSKQLRVPEHDVVKTLVVEDQDAKALIILMHGDRQVSLKTLARQIGAKRVAPCKPEVAERHTGYQVGGTSPFGMRKPLPIFLERSILELPLIYINGGHCGFLVAIAPQVLSELLQARAVDCAAPGK